MKTMKLLPIFGTLFAAMILSGCLGTTTPGGETKREAGYQIGQALPTRSRSDTAQTQAEIQALYARFALIWPEWENLIPP